MPALNIVTRSKLNADVSKDFNKIVSYAAHNQMPITWVINKPDDEKELIELLEFYYATKCPASIMMHQLQQVPVQQVPDVLLSDNIKPVSADNLTSWLTAFEDAFKVDDNNYMHALRCSIKSDFIRAHNKKYKKEHFGGYLHNKLVTTGSLFIAPDYAEISNIGTVPEARNNKMATIMIGALLKRAQELKVPHVILTAPNVEDVVFEKAGFKTVAPSDYYFLRLAILEQD
jgi:ribosomal protein S18 acetylase RimI-like enzyme